MTDVSAVQPSPISAVDLDGTGASDTAAPKRRSSALRVLTNIGWYVVLTAVAVIVLFPIWMSFVRAVSSPAEYISAGYPPYPVGWDFSSFGDAFTSGNLGPAMFRTAMFAGIVTVAQVVTSVLAAYAFTFLKFPFKRLAMVLVGASLTLPLEVTFIANAQTIRQWGWIDSLAGLVAPSLATAFGIFLVRQAMMGIPKELHEAAVLDGQGHFRFLSGVVVPLVRPVLASLTLVAFLAAWNQYLWPNAVTESEDSQVLQLAMNRLLSANVERSNVAVAGSLVASFPLIILLLLFQRQIVRGLTAGAVKG